MAITKAKKSEIYSKLSEIAKASGSRVFVNFHGLAVADSMAVRRALRAAGVKYVVAKKTIAKKVWNESGKEGAMPELPGEFAVAYGEDDFAPAREMYKLQKTFKGRLSIVGGVFEKHFANAEEITNIASIPSREVLYAQFLNLINSPIQGLVMVLDGVAKSKES